MISAFLRGKLSRQQENMEDLLTSCVFDALRYSNSENLLIEWVKSAKTLDSDPLFPDLSSHAKISYRFWPSLDKTEPDLILEIDDCPGQYAILIEAKYRSGKSSHGDETADKPTDTDQLAREWTNLSNALNDQNSQRSQYLIYLTASVVFPREDIEDSLKDITADPLEVRKRIGWVSWRHLYPILQNSSHHAITDLQCLLGKLELVLFDGIRPLESCGEIEWKFDRLDKLIWGRPMSPMTISWRFIREER